MSILKNGTILNRNQYKITKFIAQGGFGITYLAEEIGFYKHSGFGEEYVEARNPETVVVKELYYNDYCQRDEKTGLVSISNIDKKLEFQKLVKNQIDEGKTIRGLKHPNIVRTRDIFHENETAYMVMDYIESTDLEEMLKKSVYLSKEKALRYILQMLDAVDYIHTKIDKKILHLDISPSNILIDKNNDNAILIDFGSALSYDNVQNSITSTTSQIVTGRKKHYSPNEQGDIDNLKSFDATFDTYAIGATLYHLISGEKPPLSSLVSTGRIKIEPPSRLRKDGEIYEYLDALIMKSIAPMYKARYSSAAQFAKDLKSETVYDEDINRILKHSATGEFGKSLELIKAMREKYPETPTLEKLEEAVKTEIGKAEKEKEYRIFTDKGNSMLVAGEFELALNFFNNAREIFPNRAEVIEKINTCHEKLGKEKLEIPPADAEEKEETVLLQMPRKPAATVIKEEPKRKSQPEPKPDDATVLLSTPKKEPKIEKPRERPEPARPVTPEKATSPKPKKNLVIAGSVFGVVVLGVILYASGMFSSDKPVPDQNMEITAGDSLTADSTKTSLVMNEKPVVIDIEPASQKDDQKEDNKENDWKTEFNTKFNALYRSEGSQKPETLIAKYRSLLASLPAGASAERKKVNGRITALNQKINENKIVQEETDTPSSTEADDNKAWQQASGKNTVTAYNGYINDWPKGKYVSEARKRIKDLEKPKEDPVDMAGYNNALDWAKNMMSVGGCEGCKTNSTCKNQVKTKLQQALNSNPNGKEAKDLLNCLNN